jgi:hypothetical protein
MSCFLKTFLGPSLYSTHRPKRQYEANLLESTGDKMLYCSRLVRDICWATSPFWLYYVATRYTQWTRNDALFYLKMIFIYHSFAYCTRTLGRSLNSLYWQFITDYTEAVNAATNGVTGVTKLKNYDFQVSSKSKSH